MSLSRTKFEQRTFRSSAAVCTSVQCGPNSKCYGINHIATCKCVNNYVGNPLDLLKGCGRKFRISKKHRHVGPSRLMSSFRWFSFAAPDKCVKNSDCRTNQACRPAQSGIKDCFSSSLPIQIHFCRSVLTFPDDIPSDSLQIYVPT